jgi:hypothetical protein
VRHEHTCLIFSRTIRNKASYCRPMCAMCWARIISVFCCAKWSRAGICPSSRPAYSDAGGQSPYDPRLMFKVWLYAFSLNVRTTRKLEQRALLPLVDAIGEECQQPPGCVLADAAFSSQANPTAHFQPTIPPKAHSRPRLGCPCAWAVQGMCTFVHLNVGCEIQQ